MRTLLTVFLLILVPSPVFAAPKQKKKEKPDPNPAVDKIAREVFKSNDRNHNDALSRTEFHSAEREVQARLGQLASKGVLGDKKAKDVDVTVASAGNDIEKSNKISQDQFSAHVHRLAQQVNIAARQHNDAAAAQKKKMEAAKKAAAKKRANNKRKK
jgi:hypothetical protein